MMKGKVKSVTEQLVFLLNRKITSTEAAFFLISDKMSKLQNKTARSRDPFASLSLSLSHFSNILPMMNII